MGRPKRSHLSFWLLQRVDSMCYAGPDATWVEHHGLARIYYWGDLSWTLRLNGREVWVQATVSEEDPKAVAKGYRAETYLVRRLTCRLPLEGLRLREGVLDPDSIRDALIQLDPPREWLQLPHHWYGLTELKPFIKRED